eukprot:570986-Pelagomonas_calceolata.AAC.1
MGLSQRKGKSSKRLTFCIPAQGGVTFCKKVKICTSVVSHLQDDPSHNGQVVHDGDQNLLRGHVLHNSQALPDDSQALLLDTNRAFQLEEEREAKEAAAVKEAQRIKEKKEQLQAYKELRNQGPCWVSLQLMEERNAAAKAEAAYAAQVALKASYLQVGLRNEESKHDCTDPDCKVGKFTPGGLLHNSGSATAPECPWQCSSWGKMLH